MWSADSVPDFGEHAGSESGADTDDERAPDDWADFGRPSLAADDFGPLEGDDGEDDPDAGHFDRGEHEGAAPLTPEAGMNGAQPSRRVLKAHFEARRLVREARMKADEVLAEAQEQIAFLQAEAESLRDDLHDLRDELARLADEKTEATARLEEARATRERLQHDAERRAARLVAEATTEAADIRTRAQQERSAAEAALRSLRREHEAYEAQTRAIRATTNEELDGLRAQASTLRDELVRLQSELAAVLEEEARVREQLRDARAATERVEKAHREAEWVVAEATAEAEMVRADAASAHADAQAEIERLRATGSVCREQVDVLRSEAKTLGEELARLRDEIAEAREREREAVQHLEGLRETSRRVAQEARENADRLLAEARAEADLVRSAASQLLKEARADASRMRAANSGVETRSQPGPVESHETVADRLIGLHWDSLPPPDSITQTSLTTATSPDDRPPYPTAPQPDKAEIADATEVRGELERQTLETLSRLRRELTDEVERRIAEMAAVLDSRMRGEGTATIAREGEGDDGGGGGEGADRAGREAGAGREPPADSEVDNRRDQAKELEAALAYVRHVLEEELYGAAPSRARPSTEVTADEAPAETGDEGSEERERPSPQPLIGSGGWYATVPVALGPDAQRDDAPRPEPERELDRGKRSNRGRRFRRD